MAYDGALAGRIRALLARRRGVDERKMFGGVAFLLNGNMCCGVHRDDLIVRVAREEHAAALERPHVRAFDLAGKPMKGFVLVAPKGYRAEDSLKEWIAMGVRCARSFAVKTAGERSRKNVRSPNRSIKP